MEDYENKINVCEECAIWSYFINKILKFIILYNVYQLLILKS